MRTPKRVVGPLGDSQRVSNQRFRDTTAWAPTYPERARGVGGYGARHGNGTGAERAGPAAALADGDLGNLGVGFQALFTPRSFYDDFPIGRGWVAMDGPYNQHLVRDVGSLNLALVVLVFAALIVSTRALARTATIV